MSEIKDFIVSGLVLAHYNPELPLVLVSDAAQYGFGSCIAHKFPNGQERPISFVSRTLNKAEVGYSMIDKEAIAIYFGVLKFQQYLVGRHFTVKTDHKPLVSIFGGKKGIPTWQQTGYKGGPYTCLGLILMCSASQGRTMDVLMHCPD